MKLMSTHRRMQDSSLVTEWHIANENQESVSRTTDAQDQDTRFQGQRVILMNCLYSF